MFSYNHSSGVNKTCLCADSITFWCTYFRTLEWVAKSSSRGSSQSRDRTQVSSELQTDSLPSEPSEKQIKFVFSHNHSSWVNKICLCADTITFWCTYSKIFTLTPFSDSVSGCIVLNLFASILSSCHHPSLILHFTCILPSLRIQDPPPLTISPCFFLDFLT